MIVVDASAILDILLQASVAPLLRERLLVAGETLHAPCLLDVEVAHALRRHNLAGQLAPDRGVRALKTLADFPITRYPHEPLLSRIWQLRHNLTAYDAAYVSLAEALEAPLLTRDRAIASAAGHRAKIELV